MTYRERVVNRLKRLIKAAHHDERDFVYVTVWTAGVIVRLLEEQERPRIIRCRECVHYRVDGYCMYNNHSQLDKDWFCADGRRWEE